MSTVKGSLLIEVMDYLPCETAKALRNSIYAKRKYDRERHRLCDKYDRKSHRVIYRRKHELAI